MNYSNNPFGDASVQQSQDQYSSSQNLNPFGNSVGGESNAWGSVASPSSRSMSSEPFGSTVNFASPTSSVQQQQNQQQPSYGYSQNPFFMDQKQQPQASSPFQNQATGLGAHEHPSFQQPSPQQSQVSSSYPSLGFGGFEQNQFQQPPPPSQQQYPQQPQGVYSNPFSPSLGQSPASALVVSNFQSNPYASALPPSNGGALVTSPYGNPYGGPVQSNPYGGQVQSNQGQTNPYGGQVQSNPYGGGYEAQQPSGFSPYSGTDNTTGNNRANPFDPFARPASTLPPASDPFTASYPAFASDPHLQQQHPQHQHQQLQPFEFNRPKALSTGSEPCLPLSQPLPLERRSSFSVGMEQMQQYQQEQHSPSTEKIDIVGVSTSQSPPSSDRTSESRKNESQKSRSIDEPRLDEIPKTLVPPSYDYGQKPDVPPDRDLQSQESVRNKYAMQLAREAPPGASPLPKADLVRKKGYVLSRISFRTIVMKKWKQSFWVQYGPHTMLWFRSSADFDDWLNNPYHSQAERNFLIKLAVNFVHDLYKPNVRGYQVTQARTKGYGNKLVRQFKLERWMDYGPTIAAAFGSYNPKEADDLREALVECMRNTPLNNGIRATGAVRQRPPEQISAPRSRSISPEPKRSPPSATRDGGGYSRSSYDSLPADGQKNKEPPTPKEPEKPAPEVDLMDLKDWDTPSQPSSFPQQQSPVNQVFGSPGQNHQPFANQYQQPHPGQVQHFHPGQSQPSSPPQQFNSNALVVAQPQFQSYPGAPQSFTSQQHQQYYQSSNNSVQSFHSLPSAPRQQQFSDQSGPPQQQWGQPSIQHANPFLDQQQNTQAPTDDPWMPKSQQQQQHMNPYAPGSGF